MGTAGADATPDAARARRALAWLIVSTAGRVLKRLVVGQPFTNDKLGDTLLPKRIALPVFASDALSSVAYAPDEIFITLSVAGLSAYAFSWKVGLAVAIVMLTIVASYRQNVHAYPSGGGDYEVATTNIGSIAGLTVASALLVDYVLTVAVSVSSGRAERDVGAAVPQRPRDRGGGRPGPAADVREPARDPGVGQHLRRPDVLLHGLDHRDGDLGPEPDGVRAPAARGQREVHHPERPELRARAGQCPRRLPHPAHLLLRLRRADRCRGDQQRGAGVPQAQEQERRHDAAADGDPLGHDAARHHRPGQPGPPALRRPGHRHAPARLPRHGADPDGVGRGTHARRHEVRPADGDRAAGPLGVLELLAGVLLHHRRDRDHPHPGREHGVQRLPRAGLDPGPGRLTCRGSCTPAATGWPSATAS